jgi:hypothetical protein
MIAAFRPVKLKAAATSSSEVPIVAGDMLTLSAPRRMADRSHLRSREASSQLGRAQMTNFVCDRRHTTRMCQQLGIAKAKRTRQDHAC